VKKLKWLPIARLKLPSPGRRPHIGHKKFVVLSPADAQIYKVYANYPTLPKVGPTRIKFFWKGGPYPTNNVAIYLIDRRHWMGVCLASGISNVGPGRTGMFAFQMPPNFQPTDDCPGPGDPLLGGRYEFYIQGGTGNDFTWTYGSDFYIVWSS